MLKKRIVLAVTAFSLLTLPTASQALPLSEVDVVTKLADWLDRLPGTLRVTPARPARAGRNRVKNGCAIDPNGQPFCEPRLGAGAGATSSATDGGSDG